MMPLSYTGVGPTAILLMLVCLVISQGYKYYRHRKSPKEQFKER
jgi:hypothetical protein